MAVSVTFSSSSYAVFDTKKTWEAASKSCRGLGAELVKIESHAETEFINATFLSTRMKMWIGLNDIVNEPLFPLRNLFKGCGTATVGSKGHY